MENKELINEMMENAEKLSTELMAQRNILNNNKKLSEKVESITDFVVVMNGEVDVLLSVALSEQQMEELKLTISLMCNNNIKNAISTLGVLTSHGTVCAPYITDSDEEEHNGSEKENGGEKNTIAETQSATMQVKTESATKRVADEKADKPNKKPRRVYTGTITDEQLNREYFKAGTSVAVIAEKYDVEVSGIYNRIKKMKLVKAQKQKECASTQ